MSSRLYNTPSGSAKYWTGMDPAIKNKDRGPQVILVSSILRFALVTTTVRGRRAARAHSPTDAHAHPPSPSRKNLSFFLFSIHRTAVLLLIP